MALVTVEVYNLECDYSCLTCSGPTKIDCLTCSEGIVSPVGKCSCSLGLFQYGLCLSQCSDGYRQQGNICLKCGDNCKICSNSFCRNCQNHYKLVDGTFCSPYCPSGSYFLAGSCINLLESGDEESEVIFYAFNEEKNQCEIEAQQFTFSPVLVSSGSSCIYFNNYLILGDGYLFHSRESYIYKDMLKSHSFVRIFMKTFFIDSWAIGDQLQLFLDKQIVYDYTITNNVWSEYLEQNILLNISHFSNNLTFKILISNQGATGYIGVTDLQIIIDKCGCNICDANGCVLVGEQQSQCFLGQTEIEGICTDCKLLQYRLSNCQCMEHFYLNPINNSCLPCSKNCDVCHYESNFCTSCSQNYSNPPFCQCNDGLFENTLGECNQCASQCTVCNLQADLCTVCKDSNVSPPLCVCNEQIIRDPNQPCMRCTIQEPSVLFSSTIPQITIMFRDVFTLISTQCNDIFSNETYSYLGNNALCEQKNSSIAITLDEESTFVINEKLQLNQDNIIVNNCKNALKSIVLQYQNSILKSPTVILNQQAITLSNLTTDVINYQSNDLLQNIKWKIESYQIQDSGIQVLIDNWNGLLFNQSQNFFISGNQFQKDNKIILVLAYCNYQNQCGQQKLQILIKFQKDAQLYIMIKYQSPPYFQFSSLQFLIQLQQQINDQFLDLNETTNLNYSFYGKEINITKEVAVAPNDFFLIEIEENILIQYELYTLSLSANCKNLEQTKSLKILINPTPITVTIKGGNQMFPYQLQLILNLLINNQEITDNPFSHIHWACTNLTTNADCTSLDGNGLIDADNSTSITLKRNSFLPYTVALFKADAIFGNKIYSNQVTIYFVEENTPLLSITTPNHLFINNDYDDIEFSIQYSDYIIDSDLLDYRGVIISNYSIVSYFQFYYTEVKIRLLSYYSIEQYTDQLYRFAIYNQNYIIPSYFSLSLKFNSPPQKCVIDLQEQNMIFSLFAKNCEDQELPLQYRFSIYFQEPKGKLYANNDNNQIILSNFTYRNSLTTNLFGEEIIIGVEVKDIYNGISQVKGNFSITNEFTSTTNFSALIQNFNQDEKLVQLYYFLRSQKFMNLNFSEKQITQLETELNKINSVGLYNQEQYWECVLLLGSFKRSIFYSIVYNAQRDWDEIIIQSNQTLHNVSIKQNKDYYFISKSIGEQLHNLHQSFSIVLQYSEYDLMNNNRILSESQQLKYQIIAQIFKTGDLQLEMQLPNGEKMIEESDTYTITTNKFTQNQANSSEIDISLLNGTYISSQIIKFKQNILENEIVLQNVQNLNFPLYNAQILSSNSSYLITQFNGSIKYEFGGVDQNEDYGCAIKTESGWNLDKCKSTKDAQKIICECSSIGPTTIVQLLDNFKSNFLNLFTAKNINRIKNQNYVNVMFTYIEILLAIFFLWFVYYGYHLDLQHKRIQSQTKVFPQNFFGTQDTFNTGYRQPSLKTFQKSTSNQPIIIEVDETLKDKEQVEDVQSIKASEIGGEIPIQSPKSSKNEYFISEKTISSQRQQITQYPLRLRNSIINPKINKITTFQRFYKNYHKIFALYYRYDEHQSRPVRGTLLYISIIGQMSMVNWFGEVFDVVLIISLSLISYLFGLIYKRLLAFFLMNRSFVLVYLGNLIATISAFFFIFVTFSSIPLYKNVLACNLWAVGFVTGTFIDFFLYTSIQIGVMFGVVQYFQANAIFKVQCSFYQKIVKALLDPISYAIIVQES